ncbi:MAG TPA: MurR/RpiR family transcriptional regulator [Bacillales bacterium]|nr:MurR/RpiR family transcriptional regulator [Bacillales bacterium]
MLKGGLVSIQEALPHLKPSERKVAEYVLAHPEQVVSCSVQKLASLTDVSEATIVRFSRTLKCKGFQELKLRIAYDLNNEDDPNDSYEEITMDGPVHSLIRSVSRNNMQSIKDTLSVLSEEETGKAIERLRAARKIAVYGIGASAVIAGDFKQKLTRIDRWCEAGFGFDEQATISANLDKRDVVLGISNSGQTVDIIEALSIAKENGASVISLTRFGDNPVSQLADVTLFASSLEKRFRSGAMSSRISMLNVVDILYIGIASENYEESIEKLENTRKAVSPAKKDV